MPAEVCRRKSLDAVPYCTLCAFAVLRRQLPYESQAKIQSLRPLESVTSQAASATHRHPLAAAVSCRRRLCRRRPCRQTGPCCRRRLLGRPAVPRRQRGAAARRRPPLLLLAAAARPVRSACPARPAPPPAPTLPKSSSAPTPARVNQANCGSFRDDRTICMSRSAQWEL